VVNQNKLDGMIRNLRTYLKYLDKIARIKREDFLNDPTVIGGARYYLQISIESCLNLGNHVISSEGYRSPDDYRDVFAVLNENNIIPDDFTLTLRQMVGFRNRLVHLYWEIDDELIYSFLQNELKDFDRFIEYILLFVQNQE
jgi:uncharacterized protein YutE (UPF0331/DUF86 family)